MGVCVIGGRVYGYRPPTPLPFHSFTHIFLSILYLITIMLTLIYHPYIHSLTLSPIQSYTHSHIHTYTHSYRYLLNEDKGVLLSQVYDGKRRETFLLVLDAVSMKELCRAYTGHRVPISFHGQWLQG